MKKLSVVYHTHWDREWYNSAATFHIRLSKIISRVLQLLDQHEIEYFVLDGQVKALEDYLKIATKSEKARVLQYVKEQKIIIGPWYVLADEFLVSGESLIRNLYKGIQTAKEYGTYQKIGYLPDTFGHVSQMPQILQSFGIDQAILWRGVFPNDHVFMWEGSDESTLFTVFLKEGYYQPILDQEQYQTKLNNFIKTMSDFSPFDHMLLPNGGDHLMPAYAPLQERINKLKNTLNIDIVSTNYETYINQIRKNLNHENIETWKGELRDNSNIYILPNVLSARTYLKRQNQTIEDKITTELEPLICSAYLGKEYPYQPVLNQIWNTVLENHPHDSICGCSIDLVHDEMETRTNQISDTINQLKIDCFNRLNASELTRNYSNAETKIFDDYTHFSIYNASPYEKNELITARIFLNKASDLVDNFVVHDNEIPYKTTILSKQEGRYFQSPLDYNPEFRDGYYYDIMFYVEQFNGFSFKTFSLVKGTPSFLETKEENQIENEYYNISLTDTASLTIIDKKTKKTYHNMNAFISSLDQGDEYNYAKPNQDTTSKPTVKKCIVKKEDRIQKLIYTLEMELPKQLDSSRDKASKTTVINTFDCEVRLLERDATIQFHTTITNNAKDQRTRVVFDLDKENTHYSDTAFDHVKRHVRNEVYQAEKQKEVPVVVDPTLSYVQVKEQTVFTHIGLQEYQMRPIKHATRLESTLIRSVGYLSRDDASSRGGGAGPQLQTPGAQMLHTYDFDYTLSFHAESIPLERTYLRAFPRTIKGHIKPTGSLLQLSNNNIFFSSLQHHEDYLELRIFNPYETTQKTTYQSSYPIQSITVIDSLRNEVKNDPYTLQPKEIKTLKITFNNQKHIKTDCLITGASIGGVQAAIALAKEKKHVVLTDEYKWIGGQLTSQAVPLDEHPFIEEFGCTTSYRKFRDAVRKYYNEHYDVKNKNITNPGNAWVTRLSAEVDVVHHIIEDMVQEYREYIDVYPYTHPIQAVSNDHTVSSVTVEDIRTLEQTTISFDIVIDGTDTGELLPLTNTEYTTGREAKSETSEFHATKKGDTLDMQPVTHVAALRWDEDGVPMKKPKYYDFFKKMKAPYDDVYVLSPYGPDSSTGRARKFNIKTGKMPLWSYRRTFDPSLYNNTSKPETTLLNWPQNDYFMDNIFGNEYKNYHKQMAKELTKSFLYYLQTEMPREDGNKGYPEMQLDKNALGTNDGLAQAPYIRESRRIKAMKTVVQEDVSTKANNTLPHQEDSVGVGCYHIDLHITTKSHTFFYDHSWPFEIPLKAMIPIQKENLLVASKNIGTTHLTNGCFRLHPVEWNIGEVSGYLASFVIDNNITPQTLANDSKLIQAFQSYITNKGIEIHWPEDKVKPI